MLFYLVLAAALALGALGAWGLGSLLWLPVLFVLAVAVLAGLAFAFLYLSCIWVDPEKPREKDSPFFRGMAYVYIDAVIAAARVRIHTKGLEQLPAEGRFLLVCNHRHDVDSALLLSVFKKNNLAFISKRENSDMLIVGKIMPLISCQLINRENDREALKTILRCIQMLKQDRVSVAVFPEGYIYDDRKLHRFRPGVFKIAQKANVPIVVCTMKNTTAVMPNFLKLKPTDVELNLLRVITPQEYAGETTVDLANRVYEMMAADLGPELVSQE